MKRFLVILAVLFGVQYGAWADFVCNTSSFSVNSQDGQKNEACYTGDGFVELMVHFGTGLKTATDYTDVKSYLEKVAQDIGHIIVIGSADMQPYKSGDSWKKNATLSEERAKWVIDKVLPGSIKNSCNLDGRETELCSVYVTGSANDYANSNGAADANVDERVAHIYVIWKSARCSKNLVDNLKRYKEALASCAWAAQSSKTGLLDVCKTEGVIVVGNKAIELSEFLAEAGLNCMNIKQINDEVGISIEIAYQKINRFFNGLGLSVWRDRDGNFNTARLASDSIAAVVLGTAGGLITSKLVKKNQIKKGFEDLNCSIGGQRVATFGDEFSVGLQ
ncbi:MAG: hypothetical protein J5611_00725 [Alphaproteobacteria bacterium]|nr:hypothetical protein [Alphaproteobacteria bacterium]